MISLPPTPSRYWLSYVFRLALIAVLLYALVALNSAYFFHDKLYESGDLAANSLSVLRAAHFQELYGPYSRWKFHHPGPALFYGGALGEATLFRSWHLTPTPFNAQVLFVLGLLVSFFAAGLSVAVRWVRGWTFAVLALAFAVLHATAIGGETLLLSAWSAHIIPLIFFCLLLAAASVGAGQGEDLPLLALAGCFLIHLHVAQPLFVLPMFVLAYAGLIWSCWRRRAQLGTAAVPVSLAKPGDPTPAFAPPAERTVSALPWRVYRRSHWLAFLVAAVFALPILIDACLPHGNLRLILAHLHAHQGDAKHPWLDSLDYFLQFATYKPSLHSDGFYPTGTTSQALATLVTHHLRTSLLWLGALLSPLLPLAARLWRGKDPVLLGDAPATYPNHGSYVSPAGRWRFLGWLWAVWAVGVGLTLCWGRLADGPMFYFNAWFNYSLWFVLALLATGCLVDALDALFSRADYPSLWKGIVAVGCAAVAAVAVQRHPESYRATAADNDPSRAHAATIAEILATEPAGTPHTKLLLFPNGAWQGATSVAALLARRGEPFYVLPHWHTMFGQAYVLPHWHEVTETPADTNPRFEVWHFVPADTLGGEAAPHLLYDGYVLLPGGLPLDPAKDDAIRWLGEQPNYENYAVQGWNAGDTPPQEKPRVVETSAVFQFRAVPVPADRDVCVTFQLRPDLADGKLEAQRLVVRYNGHDLGTLRVTAQPPAEPLSVTIPAATWNRYASGLLTLGFPDRISPAKAGTGPDQTEYSFFMERMQFSLAKSTSSDGANPPEASMPPEVPGTPEAIPPAEPSPASHEPPEPAPMAPVPTPTPEESPAPAATPVEPAATPMETPGVSPAATPPPETMPEASPAAEPTPTATPSPSPTATPEETPAVSNPDNAPNAPDA